MKEIKGTAETRTRECATRYARLARCTWKEIGEAAGTSGNNIRAIVKRHGTRSVYLEPLDAWLRERGYWQEAEAMEADPPLDNGISGGMGEHRAGYMTDEEPLANNGGAEPTRRRGDPAKYDVISTDELQLLMRASRIPETKAMADELVQSFGLIETRLMALDVAQEQLGEALKLTDQLLGAVRRELKRHKQTK